MVDRQVQALQRLVDRGGRDAEVAAVDGKPIRSNEQLTEAIAGRKQGDKVKVTLKRGDKEKTVEVTLGDRPASADATTTSTTPGQP